MTSVSSVMWFRGHTYTVAWRGVQLTERGVAWGHTDIIAGTSLNALERRRDDAVDPREPLEELAVHVARHHKAVHLELVLREVARGALHALFTVTNVGKHPAQRALEGREEPKDNHTQEHDQHNGGTHL